MCNYRDKIVLHSNNLSNLTNDKVDHYSQRHSKGFNHFGWEARRLVRGPNLSLTEIVQIVISQRRYEAQDCGGWQCVIRDENCNQETFSVPRKRSLEKKGDGRQQ